MKNKHMHMEKNADVDLIQYLTSFFFSKQSFCA